VRSTAIAYEAIQRIFGACENPGQVASLREVGESQAGEQVGAAVSEQVSEQVSKII
jgi:hypothetical protein